MNPQSAIEVSGGGRLVNLNIPKPDEFEMLYRMSKVVASSSNRMKSEDALIVMMRGMELGIPPMEAVSQLYVVKGKVTTSVQLMIALVNRANLLSSLEIPDIEQVSREEKAMVKAIRRDRPDNVYTATFTRQDAEKAGLWGENTWKLYPSQMLINRALAVLLRKAAPEAIAGMYPPDEIDGTIVVDAVTGEPQLGTTDRKDEVEEAVIEDSDSANSQPAKDAGSATRTKRGGKRKIETGGAASDDDKPTHWCKVEVDGELQGARLLTLAVALNLGNDRKDAWEYVRTRFTPGQVYGALSELPGTYEGAQGRITEMGTELMNAVGVNQKPDFENDGWDDDSKSDFESWLMDTFDMDTEEFSGETETDYLTAAPNMRKAQAMAINAAVKNGLTFFTGEEDSVTYTENKRVLFHLPDGVQAVDETTGEAMEIVLYGGRTAFAKLVGQGYADDAGVADWSPGDTVNLLLGFSVKRVVSKGGVPRLEVQEAEIIEVEDAA